MQKVILVEDAVLRDTFWNAAIDLKKENDELKQHNNELEKRLLALWEKLEGERNHYIEHLQLNEELISEIEQENERLKEQNKRQNEAIDSLREMYAKETR